MRDSFVFASSNEQTLYLIAGIVAIEYQKVSDAFNLGGALPSDLGSLQFNEKRTAWSRLIRSSFQDNEKQLNWHTDLNNRIGTLKDIRDALMHARPRLDPFEKGEARVCFRMDRPAKRFRQRSYAYHMYRQRRAGNKLNKDTAKWWSEDEFTIEFSYTLSELQAAAQRIRELSFEVMRLTAELRRKSIDRPQPFTPHG